MANNFKKYQSNIDTSVVEARFKKSPFTVYKPIVLNDTTINNVADMQQANQYNQQYMKPQQQTEEVQELLPSVVTSEKEKEDKGPIIGRVLNTIKDVASTLEQGIISGLEGVVDFGASAIGNAARGLDKYSQFNDWNLNSEKLYNVEKETQRFIKEDITSNITNSKLYNMHLDPLGQLRGDYNYGGNALEKIREQSYISESPFAETYIRGTAESIGQMLPAIALGTVSGGASTAYFFSSAAGGGVEEALNAGASYSDAYTYGLLTGAAEAAIESLFGVGGDLVGKGIEAVGSKYFSKTYAKLATNKLVRVAANALGEGVEEVGSEILNPYLKRITFDPDAPNATNEQIFQSFIIGAAAGGIISGVNVVSESVKKDAEEIDKLIEIQSEAYNNRRFSDVAAIGEMIEKKSQRLGEKLGIEIDLTEVNAQNKLKAYNKTISRTDANKYVTAQESLQSSLAEDLKKMSKESRQKFIKENGLDYMYKSNGELKSSYANLTLEQKSDIAKINKTVKALDNTANVKFVNQAKNVQGYYSKNNNTITINLNAYDPYRVVGLHEFTHSLEGSKSYNNLRDFVVSNMKKQGKYATSFKALRSLYKNQFDQTSKVTDLKSKLQKGEMSQQDYYDTYNNMLRNYVEEEMVAKVISEEIFKSEKTINELVGENESLAKRILKWINNKIKGTEPEFNAWRKELKTAKKLYQEAINEKKEKNIVTETTDQKYFIKGDIENEFRDLQKQIRTKSFESVKEQDSYISSDEGLRKRYSDLFQRWLVYRGIDSSNTKLLHLETNNKNTFDMYENIDGKIFHDIFEIVRINTNNGELVDLHDSYDDATCYLSSNGLSGFAITNNGDLISVFNADNKRGFLYAISKIVKENSKTLDCYMSNVQNLKNMYEKVFGFKTASIMDYNMEYDHDNIAINHDMPKVAFMVNTEKSVITKYFDKDSYDETQSYQQSLVKEKTFKFSNDYKDKLKQDPFFDNYEYKTVSIDKLVKDNELDAEDHLSTYHELEWGTNIEKYSINDEKINNWGFNPPRAVYENGKYIIEDGKHRIKALQNDGYDNIELLIYNEDVKYSLKEKKPREPKVESTKDIPEKYVRARADVSQDKVYSKQEATEIYEELIHGIATEQGIAIDNDVEKKVVNYIFQQLNSDKMTSSKIADKILDFVFKKTPGFKNSIPVDFRENIINDFRAFIFTQALEGGKESFRNRMVNKVQSLKQEVKYYKDLYSKSKRVMKKVEKLREFASRDYKYTPDAEVIADMLTKAATLLRKITIDNFNKPQTREIINDFRREWYNRSNELIDVNPEIEAEFKKITDNIGSKEKLSLEEISALNNILSYMVKYINEYDKVRINGKERKVTELAREGISKVQSAKPLKTTKFSELYRKIVVKPSTYFRSIEGTVLNEEGILDTLLVKEIRRSETKFYENVMRLNEPFEIFFKNNKKYRKELSSKKLQLQGKNITLREAITIQMLSLRQQARGHFMSDVDKNAKGLRIYDDNGKTFNDFILTQADVDALYEQFTETDKQYMELVHNLFNVAARELKIETDNLLLGSTNIMEENYFPIIVDKMISYKNLGDPRSKNLDSLFGLSFNEDTVEGANNRINVMGVDTMVFSHIQKVSRYNAYMIPVKNIRQVLNKQFIVNSENKDRKSMLQFIEEKNPGFTKYLDKWLVDSVTSVRITSDEGKFLANIRKHYASYVLGLKFSTVVNQFTIIPTAINVLSTKSVLAATYTKLGKTGNLMDEYCPYVKHRNYSGSVKSSEINVESSLNSLQDRFLWFMSAADRTTIKFIWRAAQIEAKSRYGYEFGTEENLKKAGELLEETIRSTQATDTSEQPEIQRTENEIVKTLLLFSKQNTQTISTITDYIAQYQTIKSRPQTEETKAKLKEINKKGAKAISGLLASSLAYTLVAYAFKHLLDKDDEEKNDWLEIGSDFAGNVVGMVPLLGDVYNKFFEGYDMSLSVIDMFNDVSDAITGLYNAITTGNYQNSWYKFANAFGMATGIPTKNILEYGNATIRVFNPDLAYKYKSIWYNQTVSGYTEDLEKSIKDRNKKTTLSLVKQIYAEKNIDLDEELTSKLLPLFMSNEVENKASLFPKTANQTVTFDSEEYEMSDKQYRQFKKLYSQNLNKYIKSVTSNSRYTQLSAAEKAQAIKYMQDYAYFTALSKILNINTIEATKVTLLGNAINPVLIATILAKCRGSLKGEKAEIQRYINSIPGITREQKYLLYGMLGYKPLQDNAYVQVSNYLSTKGYSIQEIHTILVKCKFIEDEEE